MTEPTRWPTPIRVVGIGSPHGDDVAGWEVVRRLQERPFGDVDFRLVDGGQRLLDGLDGRGTLIVVDAALSGATPGTLHRFENVDDRLLPLRPSTTHDLGVASALRLAKTLGIAPERVIVFGIEMGSASPGSSLSPATAEAIDRVVARISEELTAQQDRRDVD
jgi:hydrogenase maturation protease